MLTNSDPQDTGATIRVNLPAGLTIVKEYLTKKNILSYLVGGYVRDTVLQRETADIDIAVNANAIQIAKELSAVLKGKYVLLDPDNNIARVIIQEEDKQYWLDISTLRGNITEDLSLRDFTINAMAIPLIHLDKKIKITDIIDPFKGHEDIKSKTIRAVSQNALRDDPIRILRAIRIAAQLSFIIEKNTDLLIIKDHALLLNTAMERVNEELCHIFSLPQTSYWLRTMERLKILEVLIPELNPTKGVEQPIEHYWDVYNHLIESVAATEDMFSTNASPQYYKSTCHVPLSGELRKYFEQRIGGMRRKDILKIAALLHDIAKPQTKMIAENGRTRFFGHDIDGAGVATQILTRLRFSNRQIHIVQRIIELHMRVGQMSQQGELPTNRAIYRYFRDAGDVGVDTLFFSLADHLAARGPGLNLSNWLEHAKVVEYTLTVHQEKKEVVYPPKLLDGCDLINVFKIQPGPEIGKILEIIREMQATGEIKTREDALAEVKNIVNVNGENDQCKQNIK